MIYVYNITGLIRSHDGSSVCVCVRGPNGPAAYVCLVCRCAILTMSKSYDHGWRCSYGDWSKTNWNQPFPTPTSASRWGDVAMSSASAETETGADDAYDAANEVAAELAAQSRDDEHVIDELVDMADERSDNKVSMKTVQAMVSALTEERDRATKHNTADGYTPSKACTPKQVKKVHMRAGKVVQAARTRDLLKSMGVDVVKNEYKKK